MNLYQSILLVVLCAYSATGELDQTLLAERNSHVQEIQDLYDSTQYKVVKIASAYYDRSRSRFHPAHKAQSLENSLARPLLNIHKTLENSAAITKTRFNELFDEYVTQVCNQVLELDDKYNSHLDQHPELDIGEHRLQRLPAHWANAVRVCEDQRSLEEREKVFGVAKKLLASDYK